MTRFDEVRDQLRSALLKLEAIPNRTLELQRQIKEVRDALAMADEVMADFDFE